MNVHRNIRNITRMLVAIFVGGMPEVVQSFAENKDFTEVREIQKRILAAYEQDISKHAPNGIVPKIRML